MPGVRDEDVPVGFCRDPEGFREARAIRGSVERAVDAIAGEHRHRGLPAPFEWWNVGRLQLLPVGDEGRLDALGVLQPERGGSEAGRRLAAHLAATAGAALSP